MRSPTRPLEMPGPELIKNNSSRRLHWESREYRLGVAREQKSLVLICIRRQSATSPLVTCPKVAVTTSPQCQPTTVRKDNSLDRIEHVV